MARLATILILTSIYLSAPSAAHAILYPTAGTAALDVAPADGTPDELTPEAANFVSHSHPDHDVSLVSERRTFVEFDILGQPAAEQMSLLFELRRGNLIGIPDQQGTVHSYEGSGEIQLADWMAPSTLVGTSAPVGADETLTVELDATAVFNAAVALGQQYLNFSFRNLVITTIDNSDADAYSSLITVGDPRLVPGTISIESVSWAKMKGLFAPVAP